MGFGPIAHASTITLDMQAPGAPGITVFRQDNNQTGAANWTAPTVDADGSPLTGHTFTQGVVFTLPAEDPLPETFEDALALNGAVPFTVPADVLSATWAVQAFDVEHHLYLRAADHAMPS